MCANTLPFLGRANDREYATFIWTLYKKTCQNRQGMKHVEKLLMHLSLSDAYCLPAVQVVLTLRYQSVHASCNERLMCCTHTLKLQQFNASVLSKIQDRSGLQSAYVVWQKRKASYASVAQTDVFATDILDIGLPLCSRSVACLDVKELLKTAAGPLDKVRQT